MVPVPGDLIEMDVVVSFDSGQFGVAVGIEQVEHPFYGIVGSGREGDDVVRYAVYLFDRRIDIVGNASDNIEHLPAVLAELLIVIPQRDGERDFSGRQSDSVFHAGRLPPVCRI